MYNYIRLPQEAFSAWTSWAAQTDVRKYGNALLINIATIVIQITLVVISGSLALRSDTFHLGSDSSFVAGAFAVALLSRIVSEGRDRKIRKWFALFGIGLLAFGAVHILLEGVERALHPRDIANWWVLAGGILGAIGNALVYTILHKTSNCKNDHVHTVFEWHVIFDFLFSVIVAISAGYALVTGASSIDATVSLYLAACMLILCGHLFEKIRRGENPH